MPKYRERGIRGNMTEKEKMLAGKIYDNVFFGPNCTIGEGCVIGAGSVVTRDIPAKSLAVGNPCKVIREITEKDSIKNMPELW